MCKSNYLNIRIICLISNDILINSYIPFLINPCTVCI